VGAAPHVVCADGGDTVACAVCDTVDLLPQGCRQPVPIAHTHGWQHATVAHGGGGIEPFKHMALVIAVIQQKGGVGKTTVAASLYAHAVCAGYDATLVDLDGQGNATVWAVGWDVFRAVQPHRGVEAITTPHGAIGVSIARCNSEAAGGIASFKHDVDLAADMRPCSRLGAGRVLPANPYMNVGRIERVLLELVPGAVVIVDTPPRIPPAMMREIMPHTHMVFSPAQPEANAMQAVPDLISEMQCNNGAGLLEADALRLVVNMRQKCANHEAWETVLRRDYGRWVSPVVIPRATAYAEMFNPKAVWKPNTAVGKTAAALWADVEETYERREAA
jgi:cellulose biosynthesis protein BcsQ